MHAPHKRLLIPLMTGFLKCYWRIFKPTVLGSRLVVVHEQKVLLVRLTYARGWYLPGGGVDRGESFLQAAQRELREECGLQAETLDLLGLYFSRRQGKSDHVAVYVVSKFSKIEKASADPEIAEMRFFDWDHLPSDTTPATRRRIEEHRRLRPLSADW